MRLRLLSSVALGGCASAGGGTAHVSWSFADAVDCGEAGVGVVTVDAAAADGSRVHKVFACDDGSGDLLLPGGDAHVVVSGDAGGARALRAEAVVDVDDGPATAAVSLRATDGGDVWLHVLLDPECVAPGLHLVLVGFDGHLAPPIHVERCGAAVALGVVDIEPGLHVVEVAGYDLVGDAVFSERTDLDVLAGVPTELVIVVRDDTAVGFEPSVVRAR